MAVWYVDPEGGNDANGGTSFANRAKTWNGFTPAAGDTIRIIANIPPWSIGTATWTDNSGTVTLGAAVTQTIDNCETAWTAGTNVTTSVVTSYRRQGSDCITVASASGVTNGQLMAYKTLGSTTDFSAYSCVSLWFGTAGSSLQTGGSISVALCSDSAGATPIATLTMPTYLVGMTGVQSIPILFENGGSALPSGVNSVAIYAGSTKPFSSSGTIYIDNIIACTAANASSHLSHASVIGKNTGGEPEWYPIQYIDGTTIALGLMGDYSSSAGSRKYRGTTQSLTTYAMLGVRTRMTSSNSTSGSSTKNASGTAVAPISWTGGWDRTAMSTQSGSSWLNGEGYQVYGWYNYNGNNWHAMPDNTIGFIAYTAYAIYHSSAYGRVFKNLGFTNCNIPHNSAGGSAYVSDIEFDNVTFGQYGVYSGIASAIAGGKVKIRARRLTGCVTYGFDASDVLTDDNADIEIKQIDNCVNGIGMSTSARAKVRNTTFANNTTYDINIVSSLQGSEILLERPTFTSGSPVLPSFSLAGASVRMTAVGGNAWDYRIYRHDVTQVMDQSTVHGTTAQSIKITVADYQHLVAQPYRVRLAKIASLSGKTVTFTCYIQRSDASNVSAGLMTLEGSVAGVGDASYVCSGAASTWEQATISFTPTEDGVVDVWGYVGASASGANTQTVWFGDTNVSST